MRSQMRTFLGKAWGVVWGVRQVSVASGLLLAATGSVAADVRLLSISRSNDCTTLSWQRESNPFSLS